MAVGLPAKTTYVNGDVFSASDINDTNGTLNLLNPTDKGSIVSASAANTPSRLSVGTNGQLLSADSTTATGLAWSHGGKRTAYTPTWAVISGTAPTLGNGTLVGNYNRVGDLVYFNVVLTFGSTTTAGSGTYTFTLPVTMGSVSYGVAGSSSVLDSGIAWYRGYIPNTVELADPNKFIIQSAGGAPVGNATPFSFGNADQIYAWGVYSV